jgi:transposase
LNQAEAAELLGVSERTFRRWRRRYEKEGEGPASSTAGSARRRANGSRATRAEEVERLYRERDLGFTVKPFHEHLI